MTRPYSLRIHAHGGPEQLRPEPLELAPPGPGEVRVAHTVIGVNFIDTYHRTGLYPLALPSSIGVEAAGVVEAIGAGVEGLSVGQRVGYASAGVGAYATHRNVPAARLLALPPHVSDELAAASMLKGMTVEFLTHRCFRVEPGMTVLWHAAAGGVGLLACQWLSARGVTVIGTVSTEDKAALARAHGCAHTIVTSREDFVARLRELAPDKVPVVYDSVGKDTLLKSLDCLAPLGMLVTFGQSSGPADPLNLGILGAKGSLFVTRPTLFTYIAKKAALADAANALFDVVANGTVKIEISAEYALKDAAQAHRDLEARKTTGAVILVP
jgi:NADPH2:quinone reductase